MKDDDKIIMSKTLAFAISSPIDTYRQNKLTHNAPTLKKTYAGIGTGIVASSLIAIPCHKTISFLEKVEMNELLSVSIGVLIANIFKIPILYNYRRVQTGLKITKKVPMNKLREVMKVSLIEDVLEETVKYNISKKRMNAGESTVMRNIIESVMLFSIAYPFDIIKNRGIYDMAHIRGGKKDFVSKAMHKNIQNVLFFGLVSK